MQPSCNGNWFLGHVPSTGAPSVSYDPNVEQIKRVVRVPSTREAVHVFVWELLARTNGKTFNKYQTRNDEPSNGFQGQALPYWPVNPYNSVFGLR